MKETISLILPAQPKNVRVARLTLAAIASRLPFNVDQTEDMKLALAEACNNVIEHAKETKDLEIKFESNANKLTIIVTDQGQGFEPEKMDETKGLGLVFIKSLMDEVEFKALSPQGMQISLTKKFKA